MLIDNDREDDGRKRPNRNHHRFAKQPLGNLRRDVFQAGRDALSARLAQGASKHIVELIDQGTTIAKILGYFREECVARRIGDVLSEGVGQMQKGVSIPIFGHDDPASPAEFFNVASNLLKYAVEFGYIRSRSHSLLLKQPHNPFPQFLPFRAF